MKTRRTYRARFYGQPSIRISAVNEKQATIIATAIAKKHGWKIESIGIVI